MFKYPVIKALKFTAGTVVLTAMAGSAVAAAGTNPFELRELDRGYRLAAAEAQCGEAKCGAKAKPAPARAAEANCGANKAVEAKCGAEGKAAMPKPIVEAKCGNGK